MLNYKLRPFSGFLSKKGYITKTLQIHTRSKKWEKGEVKSQQVIPLSHISPRMSGLPRRTRKAVVAGAGPVGCLAALALAKQGWDVEIYECRAGMFHADQCFCCHLHKSHADLRHTSRTPLLQQRSINLAISHRGIAALEVVNPATAQRFLQDAIPMRGRMIHTLSGRLDSQPYDKDGQVCT